MPNRQFLLAVFTTCFASPLDEGLPLSARAAPVECPFRERPSRSRALPLASPVPGLRTRASLCNATSACNDRRASLLESSARKRSTSLTLPALPGGPSAFAP